MVKRSSIVASVVGTVGLAVGLAVGGAVGTGVTARPNSLDQNSQIPSSSQIIGGIAINGGRDIEETSNALDGFFDDWNNQLTDPQLTSSEKTPKTQEVADIYVISAENPSLKLELQTTNTSTSTKSDATPLTEVNSPSLEAIIAPKEDDVSEVGEADLMNRAIKNYAGSKPNSSVSEKEAPTQNYTNMTLTVLNHMVPGSLTAQYLEKDHSEIPRTVYVKNPRVEQTAESLGSEVKRLNGIINEKVSGSLEGFLDEGMTAKFNDTNLLTRENAVIVYGAAALEVAGKSSAGAGNVEYDVETAKAAGEVIFNELSSSISERELRTLATIYVGGKRIRHRVEEKVPPWNEYASFTDFGYVFKKGGKQ